VSDLGRTLIVVGLLIVLIGAVLAFGPRLPWLGRLPGDFNVEGERFSFHFPLVTCLILSAIATILLNVFFRR